MKQIGETTSIPGLTLVENEIIKAAQGVKIRDLITQDGITQEGQLKLTETLMRANMNLAGKKMTDSDNFKILLVSVVELLAEKHKYASLDEVCRAIQYGSLGEWKKDGETLYLSATNINQWIKSYLAEKKLPAFAKKSQMALPEKIGISEEEKEKIVVDALISRFENFKDTGDVDYGATVSYDYLNEKGLIPFTKERKLSMMKEAEKIVKSEAAQKDLFSMREMLKTLEKDNAPVIIEAKIIAIKTLFREMIEMDKSIKDLLTTAGTK